MKPILNKTSILILQALACLAIAGCGGSGQDSTATQGGVLAPDVAEGVHLPPASEMQHALAVAPAGSYLTNFDGTENPISEGAVWRRASNSWRDVKTANGIAYGTSTGIDAHDDSYALLSGSFAADQTIEAVAYRDASLTPGPTHEVELLLRMSDANGVARGYECLFSWNGGFQILRWNGALGDYTYLPLTASGYLGRALVTGDVLKATIVGGVITMYVNGALMARETEKRGTSAWAGEEPDARLAARERGVGRASHQGTVDVHVDDTTDDGCLEHITRDQGSAQIAARRQGQVGVVARRTVPPQDLEPARHAEQALVAARDAVGIGHPKQQFDLVRRTG